MKNAFYSAAFILLTAGSLFLAGCPSNSSYNPSTPYNNPANTNTPVVTGTPTGTPTVTATRTQTGTPTNSPTATLTGTPTNSPTTTPTATITDTPTITATATITDTPTATPEVFTITIQDGSLGTYSGYYYSSPSGTNDTTTGVFSMTVPAGSIVNMPAFSFHPLYLFVSGSGTCMTGFSGETNSSTPVTFSAGTYNFQCGVHAVCTGNKASCSPGSCTALAGVLTVTP